MSVFTFSVPTFTSGAGTADTVALTTLQFMAIQGGTATQVSFVDEINLHGQVGGTTSTPYIGVLAHDTTVGTTLTALAGPNSFGPDDPGAGVLTAPPVAYVTVGATFPQRAATVTVAKKVFGFNLLGGTLGRNYANTKGRFGIVGNTQPLGELSLSAYSGTTSGLMGGHIMVECM